MSSLWKRERWGGGFLRAYWFREEGNGEGRVEGGGDGGASGIMGAESDVSETIGVHAGAGDGAIDLEAGLEVQN